MNAIEHRGESGGSARHGKGAVVWICGRVLRTGASPAGRVDKPVDNADALPTASPTLSRLSPTSSTGPTTGDSQRLPLPALRFNICVPLKPIPTSPTGWLTHNPSGSFPYGIRLTCATSPTTKTAAGCEPATAPKTPPACDASPSASSRRVGSRSPRPCDDSTERSAVSSTSSKRPPIPSHDPTADAQRLAAFHRPAKPPSERAGSPPGPQRPKMPVR